MSKKASTILVIILFICIGLISVKDVLFQGYINVSMVSAQPKAMKRALINGTFIQWWLVKDWDDTRWEEEFKILKEAGVKYIILAPTAFYTDNGKSGGGKTYTIYPTKTEGFEVLKNDQGKKYPDIVDACLRNAREADMKVFLGLNFSDEWWHRRLDAEWVYARMREGNKVADELWNNYYQKYPDTFYGWYWCWEVDNFYFSTIDLFKSKRKMLAKAIRIHMDHFDKTGKHLPFMLSPFMNWKLGRPEAYARMWEYVFRNSGMKSGDIFCPQDSIGTGGLELDNLGKWFSELRKAVNAKPGLKLWADIETFDDTYWTAATIKRFISQIEEVSPYVDNCVTFSYSHYYSPFNTDPGFHKTYTEYIKTGNVETSPPTTPSYLRALVYSGQSVYLSWNKAKDNIGVCGYYVYRNGELIANKQVKRKNSGINNEDNKEPINVFKDKDVKPNKTYTYQVQAYDFAGNVSAKTKEISVTVK